MCWFDRKGPWIRLSFGSSGLFELNSTQHANYLCSYVVAACSRSTWGGVETSGWWEWRVKPLLSCLAEFCSAGVKSCANASRAKPLRRWRLITHLHDRPLSHGDKGKWRQVLQCVCLCVCALSLLDQFAVDSPGPQFPFNKKHLSRSELKGREEAAAAAFNTSVTGCQAYPSGDRRINKDVVLLCWSCTLGHRFCQCLINLARTKMSNSDSMRVEPC